LKENAVTWVGFSLSNWLSNGYFTSLENLKAGAGGGSVENEKKGGMIEMKPT